MIDDELIRGLREMGERFEQELSPVATAHQLEVTEQELGHRLPAFLRRVYAEVCNGGIGRRDEWKRLWLSGVLGGTGNDWDIDALDEYLERRGEATGDEDRDWPSGLLPVAHLGCGAHLCVDCTTPEGHLVRYENSDPDVDWFPRDSFHPFGQTIRQWLAGWLGAEETTYRFPSVER